MHKIVNIKSIYNKLLQKKKTFITNCYKKFITYKHIFDCEHYEKKAYNFETFLNNF